MAKTVTLFRADAEYLVDLLDSVEPDDPESYIAQELSGHLRESFGMTAGGGTGRRQPSQDSRDAARYRWLRDSGPEVPRWAVVHEQPGREDSYQGEELDAAIDAAMGE